MFSRILVVCQGNICRSAMAESFLRMHLPECRISSAGLGALVGEEMAPLARKVAERHGVVCGAHRARNLDADLCRDHDLILVMERRQREHILGKFPGGSGKTFMLTHWSGGEDIPDPWRRNEAAYERAFELIRQGATDWVMKLNKPTTER